MSFPSLPQTQVLSSSSYVAPALDGSLTLPQLWEHNFTHNASHPMFVYDQDGEVHTIPWGEVGDAVHNAAKYITSQVDPTIADRPVIGILAVLDQLSFFALLAGIIRAGFLAFPISPRNSDAGVAHLLGKMNVKYLLVSDDERMRQVSKSACSKLTSKPEILSIPLYEDFFKPVDDSPLAPVPIQGMEDPILVLHSSGSTSFPKPIILTNRIALEWGRQPYYGEIDLCGKLFTTHCLPFFHAMGTLTYLWATTTGLVLSNFAPKHPPVVPTSDGVFESAQAVKANIMMGMPTYLEDWAANQTQLAALKDFDTVIYGGGPIREFTGDRITEAGIPLFPFYGATETGGTSWFLLKSPPKEGWMYFHISPHCELELLDEENGVGRAIFKKASSHTPAVSNHNGVDYDTSDLLVRHPTNPTLFRVFGRSDDQIMHSTGEKTNPGPLEAFVNRHPMVRCSVMFGRARFQAGIIVEPEQEFGFDASDESRLIAFRNTIWSAVEEANKFAPAHSRIFKEMILVTSPSKPFEYTPKGTVKRQATLNLYDSEINQVYIDVEQATQPDIPLPITLELAECVQYARTVVHRVLGKTIGDDDDIFQHGGDSLKVTWIRNSLLRALRELEAATENIPLNFVYQHPTVNALAVFMTMSGVLRTPEQVIRDRSASMEAMVRKYTQDFPQHVPRFHEQSKEEVVLLTGSTGGLGSYTLETLVLSPDISRIYALNRKGRQSAKDRQRAAFADRGIAEELLDSPKVTFLEGDPSLENLGLESEVFEEVRQTMTCVMHIGWRVDFNVGLSSMEPLIAGTRRLIDMALSSPQKIVPPVMFAGSIGVVKNWDKTKGPVPESALTDPSVAVSSGYPESKWVAERILDIAGEQTALRPVIVRIGQMSGGRNGSWNKDEWVPGIVKSAQILGCMPSAKGLASWIPVHEAAVAFVEMRRSSHVFMHLIHANPVSWDAIFEPISHVYSVPLVDYSKWLAVLEGSGEDAERNPALKLVDFYQQGTEEVYDRERGETMGFPILTMDETIKAAPSLRSFKPISGEDVVGWLAYWEKVGLLEQASGNIFKS